MSTLKILVIDDEPGIRSGISRILRNFRVDYPFMEEAFDFEVFEASTGEAGIGIIENNKPDILLLDNKLPGIQGIEVLEYIRKKQYDFTVVMITSYASLELAVKATSDGASDFIPKPFTPQELRSSIENITKKIFLKKMTATLKETDKQVRFQFLSVLSHELKAPLNAIEGYLKIARDHQLGDKIEDYHAIFDRSVERIHGMRTLILDLLDITRVESGKTQQNIVDTDLVKAMQKAVAAIQPSSAEREIRINLHGSDPIWMKADINEIDIIFNNLVSNAVKYNKDKGLVDIHIEENDGMTKIRVEDTGIGMTEGEMAKLFQDFVRIKNEKTKYITGSGLGLSIVKKLVENYGGTIDVTSIPDKGSTFIVSLPKERSCS
jgi:signal transduction histidine kinase